MWQVLRRSRESSEFASSASELVRSTTHFLIAAMGGVYLLWHIVATATWPDTLGEPVWLMTLVVVATLGLSYKLLSTHLLLAEIIWQLGIAVTITLGVLLLEQPLVALAFAILPFVASVTLGGAGGVAAEVLIALLIGWLWRAGLLVAMPASYALGTMLAGAFGCLTGWAASRTLYTVTQWSLYALEEARRNTEDARQHRAQLARVVKDLDQAYYRLERANSALIAAWKAAEEAERFKAELAATVSHELRTPLNLIAGFSEMMMTSPESYGVPLPGSYRSDLNAVYNSAQHLLQLVDDVLDLSRLDVGKIGLARDRVDVPALVAETVEMVRDYIAAKGLQIVVDMAKPLPELYVDRLRIRQVLLNLLVNAARFTQRGEIRISVTARGEEIRFSVADTGRGIPEEELPRVFEEYRGNPQAQAQSGWHSGTGLGLPISKKLVELHRGRIGVSSVAGEGSTFWFTLPVSAAASERQPAPLLHLRGQPSLAGSERILVAIHPEPEVVRLLQRHLEGYHIVAARDMVEATVLAREQEAIAILVAEDSEEQTLPDGVLVARCPLPSSRQTAEALGACGLLVKPVAKEDLLAAIGRLSRPVERVLIADDDPEMARLYRRYLAPRVAARDCIEAHTGTETLALLRAHRPDLLLLDLMMPELDGRQVLTLMHADPELAAIPVIIASAKADDYMPMPLAGSFRLECAEGFRLGEMLKTLQAALSVLARGWN